MLRLCSLLVPLLLIALPVHLSAATQISGAVHVIDGDTIDVGSTRVRLMGIDAPEQDQTCKHPTHGDWRCGAEVTRAVGKWLEGRNVTCDQTGTDRYGRALAICWYQGADVGGVLVSEGLAFAFKRYSERYVREERAALQAGRGLWTSAVMPPEDHRAARSTPRASDPTPANCHIKGNVSRDGKRIYHVPGQSFYDRTRINTRKGERCFASEEEARIAGWRKARR